MAHFAEVDENNIVIRVVLIPDEHEHRGQDYLAKDMGLGGRWLQTSYNTVAGVHVDPQSRQPDGGRAFRKNYAGIGFVYDETRDAFISPQPFSSWVLDEASCTWHAPVPYPDPDRFYLWDESQQQWMSPVGPPPPAPPPTLWNKLVQSVRTFVGV